MATPATTKVEKKTLAAQAINQLTAEAAGGRQ
jgi:hypothetical protein